MKSQELRIGNYIISDYGIICSVECIESKQFTDWNSGNDYSIIAKQTGTKDNYLNCINDSWQPIPLTEEILLKCGFVFGIRLQDFVKGKYCFVEIFVESLGIKFYGEFSENEVFYFNSKTEIKYLHQLQNLYFALTGEELEINL